MRVVHSIVNVPFPVSVIVLWLRRATLLHLSIMASHVRAPWETQNALQWLADSDQDQVKEAAALLPVHHRSTLMTTLSRSFCADDASGSSNPWAGFTLDPPASSASTSAQADVGQAAPPPPPEGQSPFPAPAEPKHLKFHGVSVRSIHCIACREPCQLCNLAFCGFSARIPATHISLPEGVTLVRSVIARTEIARKRKSRSGATGKEVGNPMTGGAESGSPSLDFVHCIWSPAALHAAVTLHCLPALHGQGLALHYMLEAVTDVWSIPP